MKLYATTKGKASKGQGSNDKLTTTFTYEDERGFNIECFEVKMWVQGDYIHLRATPKVGYKINNWTDHDTVDIEVKGKSQKGECKHDINNMTDSRGFECHDCGYYEAR